MRQGVWGRNVVGGKGDAEVDAVLERVASSPLWSRVRQKVLQIVENFEIYMPSESGRGTPTARHDLQAAFPLFMCVPPFREEKCMQNILLLRRAVLL